MKNKLIFNILRALACASVRPNLKSVIALSVGIAFLAMGNSAFAQKTWLQPNVTIQSWNTSAPWSPSGAPTASDDVLFSTTVEASAFRINMNTDVARDITFNRTTAGSVLLTAVTNGTSSLTATSLAVTAGGLQLIGGLTLTLSGNLNVSSVLNAGQNSANTNFAAIHALTVGGITSLNSGGTFSFSRILGAPATAVNLGALNMNDGTLNLIAGTTNANGTVTGDTNQINVNRLYGTTGLIQGNKTATSGNTTVGHLVINGTVDGSYGGTIVDGLVRNQVRITKDGTSVQTLSGANTYTGTTTVTAGTLLVNGAHTTAGAYSVGAAGTLGGTGSVTTASNAGVTLVDGASLSPGDSSAANFTMTLGTGVLDISAMATAAKLQFSLGTASDMITLSTGTLSIGTLNSSEFAFTAGAGFAAGTYTLFDTNSTITSISLDTATFSIGSFTAQLQFANGNQDIQLLVVPEPGTAGLFGIAAAFLLFRRRKFIAE